MSEFPRETLAEILDGGWLLDFEEEALRHAIKAYDELSLRCVEDNTKHSLTIATLRQRIAELETLNPLTP